MEGVHAYMHISVNRNHEACCTCVFWGGSRKISTERFDEIHTHENQAGLCNAPGIIERPERKALDSCPHWREV